MAAHSSSWANPFPATGARRHRQERQGQKIGRQVNGLQRKSRAGLRRGRRAHKRKEDAAQPNSTSPNPDSAVARQIADRQPRKTERSTANPNGPGFIAVPLPAKPHENSTSQILTDAVAKR